LGSSGSLINFWASIRKIIANKKKGDGDREKPKEERRAHLKDKYGQHLRGSKSKVMILSKKRRVHHSRGTTADAGERGGKGKNVRET